MKLALVLAAPLLAAAAAFAQDGTVEKALKDLGSEDYGVREKAAATLRKEGAAAAEALRKASEQDPDPEVRQRAKQLLEELARPGAAPKAPAPRAGARPGTVVVKMINGDATYVLTPASGESITFQRRADGSVRLEHPDGRGGSAVVEAASLEAFLKDHAKLAARFGITAEGIDLDGLKVAFGAKVRELPRRWKLEEEFPAEPFDGLQEELRRMMDELRKRRPLELPPDWDPEGFFGVPAVKGARLGAVPELLRSHLKLPEGRGVVVESVREGSTAEAAGLKTHDVILEIDGKPVSSSRDVKELLKGDSTVKVVRGGREENVKPAPKEY